MAFISLNQLASLKRRECVDFGRVDLGKLEKLVARQEPFSFVRFSDGEIEILRNRPLVISGDIVEFRGRVFRNQFPPMDEKTFNPERHHSVRHALLKAAMFRAEKFFKGIPTSHNRVLRDREFMLRLHGGYTEQVTFSDLFVNENYLYARDNFFPMLISKFKDILIIGNWRCQPRDQLRDAKLIGVRDNFFVDFDETRSHIVENIIDAPTGSLILSSASSLSNIIGLDLFKTRPDLTFLDVGTAINHLLGLPSMTRAYHKLAKNNIKGLGYRLSTEYRLKW